MALRTGSGANDSRALGIEVDDGGSAALRFVGDGQSDGKGGLARPALLRDQRDDMHTKQFSGHFRCERRAAVTPPAAVAGLAPLESLITAEL